MQPDALLIDAMGTLVALKDPAPRLAETVARRLGVALAVDDARAALAAEIAYYREHMLQGRDAPSLRALRTRCGAVVQSALPALAGADPAEVTAALLQALRFTAQPDAAALLERMRAAGTRVVVVSNWDVSLPDALAQAGLLALVDGVVTSAGAGVGKPDPAIFHHALALAGATPDRCLHVGDSFAEDVQGARAAGVEPVLLDRSMTFGGGGVRVITGLHEL